VAALLALLVVGWGRHGRAEGGRAGSVTQQVAQAKHYLRRGHLDQARQTIIEALETPEGRSDPRLQMEAAKLYRDLGDIPLALHALDEVLEEGSEAQQEKAQRMKEQLAKAYGELHISPRGEERQLMGRVFLEEARPLIATRQKQVMRRTQARLLGEARRYPASVWIPFGPLRVNGVEVEHSVGSLTRVKVPFPKVAVVRSEDRAADQAPLDAMLAGVGGRPKVYAMEGSLDEGLRIMGALRADPPALVIALGAKAAVLTRRELGDLPLVFGMLEHDWHCYDLHGEGALLGVSTAPPPTLVAQRLRELLPGARAVGLLHNPSLCPARMEAIEQALRAVKMTSTKLPVRSDGSVAAALLRDGARVDALWMLPDPPLTRLKVFRRLLEEALRRRLPLLVPSGELVRSGALAALEGERGEVGRQMAMLARRLLYGGEPPDEPDVLPPGRQVWHLNLTNAERIGLKPSPALERSADRLHRDLPALSNP